MKHTVRINGEVKELDFECSAGFLDVNDVEVFEGDRVEFLDKETGKSLKGTVLLENGRLFIEEDIYFTAFDFWKVSNVKVIGHVSEEEK